MFRFRHSVLAVLFVLSVLILNLAAAQQPELESSEPAGFAATNTIRFSGTVQNPGRTGAVSVTFSIYADADGAVPLWSETQTVRTDRQGRYTVLLGAQSGGIPVELFAGESARWLGARTPDGRESKTLLVSVPYALKAAFAGDAQTLAGQPAANFITRQELVNSQIVLASGDIVPLATSGTAGFIGKFTNTTDLGNSVIFESSGNIGIGTNNPLRTLHITGTSGALLFDATNLASNPVLFFAHDNFIGLTGTKFRNRIMLDRTNESMQIWSQNGPRLFVVGDRVGINVAAPTQTLDVAGAVRAASGVVFGDGSSLTSALSVGDITQVTVGSGLTGGGSSGAVSIGLDTTVARTIGNQTITGNLTLNGSITLNVGVCPGVACKQMVLGGYTPIGGASASGLSPQADGFGLNVLYPDGSPALVVDTTGAAGSAILKGTQKNFAGSFIRDAPAGLRGDAIANCTECAAYGVIGTSNTGSNSIGTLGWSTGGYGVYGITDAEFGVGTTGWSSNAFGTGYGLWGTVEGEAASAALLTVDTPGWLILGAQWDGITYTEVFNLDGFGDIWTDGWVSIGTDQFADRLQVFGDIRVGTSGTNGCLKNFGGGVIVGTCSSDLRLKRDIVPFAPVLSNLTQLQPVSFSWRAEEHPEYHFGPGRNRGLIAQEVEKLFPDLVVTDERGFKAVDYSALPLLLLQAVKEVQAEKEALVAANAEKDKKIADLEARIAAIEAALNRR